MSPPKTPEEGYHVSEDMVDQANVWIREQHTMTPDKPFMVYMSFGATHAPPSVAGRLA